ncbi:MAG: hypothetical protein KBC57_03335 [Neisseriaceae bacterium]|nr:hypothetical protein [Neisseriaceae bacterium]
MTQHYFVISLGHSKKADDFILFWRPDNCGYTFCVEKAGLYTEQQVLDSLGYYNSGDGTLAVPAAVINRLANKMPCLFNAYDESGSYVLNHNAVWEAIIKAAPFKTEYPLFGGSKERTKRFGKGFKLPSTA